jgi:hypothetical protein
LRPPKPRQRAQAAGCDRGLPAALALTAAHARVY